MPALHAVVGDSHLDGSGALTRRNLRVRLRLHVLSAEARLVGLQPAAPIDAQLLADGPARALRVRGRARLEAAQLSWRGRVDLPSRRGVVQLIARAVQPTRLVPGAPALTVSGTVDFAGRVTARALVGRIRLANGTVDVQGRRIDGIAADMPSARLGRDGQIWFRHLSGSWKRRPFAAGGHLSWNRRQLEVRRAVADFSGAHVEADARYQPAGGVLTVRAAPLSLSRALVSRLLGRPSPRAWTGSALIAGRRGEVGIDVELSTHVGTLRLATRLQRIGTSFDLRNVEAWLGDSHLRGALQVRSGRLAVAVEELVLSPALVHQVWPALTPAWPIRLRGALAGRQLFALRAELEAGPSTARISGRISGGRFQLAALVDHLDMMVLRPSDKRIRGTMELAVNGRLARGGVVGTLAIRDAHGYFLESPFFHGAADARLDGRGFTLSRAEAQLPGAKIIGEGSGALGSGAHIDFGVVITNALALRQVPRGLRVLIGVNSMLPGRSVVGAIDKQPGQRYTVSYRVLPIGVAQLDFLFRLLTGRYSSAQMRLSGHR